ncbi:WXG100 family type VII secretion target [Dactylosporangium sp. CA-233914]|uniref:WXG100 family type VII secretion target n=1 Tax=Dactylosporangium sp. CA-233914 TaxID=3239934 RepID=UPI003D8BF133
MASTIHITPQMLLDGAQSCTDTAGHVTSELGALRRYVEGLAAYWLGNGSAAYQSLMEDYDRQGRLMNDALIGIADGLKGNFHNYTTTEAEVMTGAPKITGGAPKINLDR